MLQCGWMQFLCICTVLFAVCIPTEQCTQSSQSLSASSFNVGREAALMVTQSPFTTNLLRLCVLKSTQKISMPPLSITVNTIRMNLVECKVDQEKGTICCWYIGQYVLLELNICFHHYSNTHIKLLLVFRDYFKLSGLRFGKWYKINRYFKVSTKIALCSHCTGLTDCWISPAT